MMWQYTQQETKVLLVATLFVFAGFGLLIASSWQTSAVAERQLANSVGVLAGVPENEYNSLAIALDERAEELDAREEALLLQAQAQVDADQHMLLLISVIGAGLLGLILLNFYLDAHRRRTLR